MKYSIDTSSLVDAWHRLYPIDVMPALWEGFHELVAIGDLRASEEVIHEIERKDDTLFQWVTNHPGLSVPIDATIQPLVSHILTSHRQLLDTRKGRSGADPFVIAMAQQHNCTVVTNERRTNSSNRPNIPDVCAALRIRCVNVLELIREQRWVFHRG